MGLHLEQVAVPMRQQTMGLQCNSVRSILLKRTAPSAEKLVLAAAMSAAVQESLWEKRVGM